jgi:hypothetical protein
MPSGTVGMPLLLQGAFACPRCGTLASAIPVAQLIAGGLNPVAGVAGFCSRCEHSYQAVLGSPSTTTTGAANTAGPTTLTVAAGAGFVTVGALVCIDAASADGGAEIVQVSSAGGSTTIPIASTPLKVTHAAGATVQTCTLKDMQPLSPNLSGG